MKMKCALAIFLAALPVFLLACSQTVAPPTDQLTAPPTDQTTAPPSQLTNENWNLVLAEAQGAQTAYIDLPVVLSGEVRQIIIGTGSTTLQLIIDTKYNNSPLGEDTLIELHEYISVKEGNSVKIEGKLENYWTTTSAAGVEIKIPVVNADNVTVTLN
jgi:hypothetical protein